MTPRPSVLGLSGFGIRVAASCAASVFIIDGVRLDGSPYTTSVSTAGSITERAKALQIRRGWVSHWVRDDQSPKFFILGYPKSSGHADWRLHERFAL